MPWVRLIAALITLTSSIPGAWGSESAPTLADYHVTTWSERDGVPPIVAVMAQTDDGWLWFGSPSGLLRFDGIRFERVEIEGRDTQRSPGVSMLYALASGGLAIGTQQDGVFFLKDGRFTRDGSLTTRKAGYIIDLVQDLDGGLWATAANGLLHHDGRAWALVGRERGYPVGSATVASVDSDGTLWISTSSGIVRLGRGQSMFEILGIKPDKYVDFLQLQDGTMWLYDENGHVQRLPWTIAKPRDPADTRRRSMAEILDRRGTLWTMESNVESRLLRRPTLDYKSVARMATAALEDRQGNIWISGADGTVNRFHRSSIVAVLPKPPFKAPLKAAFVVDEPGRLWMALSLDFARVDAEGIWMFDGTLHRVQPDEIRSATAIARQTNGSLWVGGRDGLWRRDHERFERAVALPDEARNKVVNGLAPDCADGLWVAVQGIGLIRHDGSRWQRNGGLDGLPVDSPPPVLTCDAVDRLWLGYADGRVARIDQERVVMFDAASGLDVGAVTSIHVGAKLTLVAGERGLAVLRGDRFVPLNVADAVAVERASGIAETSGGDLWLNNMHGVAHLSAGDLAKAGSAPNSPIAVDTFDASDGYPAPGFSFTISPPSIAVTGGQQVVFAGNTGLALIDPAGLDRGDGDAAAVVIRSVTAAGVRRGPTDFARFPASTRDLEVDYTALDYSHPDRLRFRYRLEGVQEQWVEAGTRREAFYTNLGPGSYRFVVNATGANGLWSERDAAFDFVIPPTFVQSRRFLVLCIAMALALLGFAYRLRVKSIRSRERQLVENRLRERERIARELHDTLLQGTQGLIVAVQAVANRVSADDPLRAMLQTSLTRANRVMAEGRDRIQALRSAGDASDDLPQSLTRVGEELAADVDVRFEATVEGTPRDLVSEVAAEILGIAREALTNAFRHADARSIELQIVYLDDQLLVRVRDDGHGIDPAALEAGARAAHWGLPGMRERAASMDATLDIWSRTGTGTEIELKVPGGTAYAGYRPGVDR